MGSVPVKLTPSVAGVVALICVMLGFLLIRRLFFRHRAECWFCSQPATVSYFKRNSFICPHCDQYNGFTEDGDYNKPIPAMYSSFLNTTRPHTEVPGGQAPGRNHFLCATCQNNQATKIQQLASFVPISEVTFEVEYRDFAEQQDELYQLCPPCLLQVNREIDRQDRVLAPTLHYYQLKERWEEKKAGSWLNRWFYNLLIITFRLATVAATACLCAPDILELLGDDWKQHSKWFKSHNRQPLALTALSMLVLSVLLAGKGRLRRIDVFFLVLLLLIVAFPQVRHLPEPLKSTLSDGSRHLLTPLCLVTSVLWLFIPYLGAGKPKKVRRSPILRTERVNNYEVSSANEGDRDEGDTAIPRTPPHVGGHTLGPVNEGDRDEGDTAIPRTPPHVGGHTLGPGPSHMQQSPVRNGMGSLTLGPPENIQRRQNDAWTSRLGNNTPPPPETDGPRPVVHPARFNFASGSLSGSAASSMVDGPTAPHTANGTAYHRPRASQGNVKPARDEATSEGDETSGASESSDEGFSSISQRSRESRRRRGYPSRRRRGRDRRRKWRNAATSFFKSLVLPVVFGISIGLNLSAALYLHYKDP